MDHFTDYAVLLIAFDLALVSFAMIVMGAIGLIGDHLEHRQWLAQRDAQSNRQRRVLRLR